MSKYKKIIIISQTFFSKRDYLRFGVDYFIENGFEVELWDINSVLYPDASTRVIVMNPVTFKSLKKFSTKNEVLSEIGKLSGDVLIITFVSLCYNSLWLFRSIKKNSLDYAVCNLGSIPPFNLKKKILVKEHFNLKALIKFYRKLSIGAVFDYMFRHLPNELYKYIGVKPATIFVAGSNKSLLSGEYFLDDKTKYCLAHSFDYDRYLEDSNRSMAYQQESKYAVFLDQFLPFHSDFLYSGRSVVTESAYYPSLSRFFDYISSELGVEVIIAAHPRSYYDKLPDYFNGRQRILGETENLVKMSEFVIMHDSTAINYAIIYNRPIIFITTNEIDETYEGEHTRDLADLFNKKVINIDESLNVGLSYLMKIDSEKYDQYMEEYIKIKGTPEKPIWEIFIDEICR